MIKSILEMSTVIKNGRSIKDILNYAMEEMGELATEVNIATGFSTKDPGKDGIVGEAIDVITCMVDLIKVSTPDITEQQLQDICTKKLNKWLANQSEHAIMIESTATEQAPEQFSRYPYLGIWHDSFLETYTIVLFTGPSTGFVVNSNGTSVDDEVGHHSDRWAEDMFAPYAGTVELRNN